MEIKEKLLNENNIEEQHIENDFSCQNHRNTHKNQHHDEEEEIVDNLRTQLVIYKIRNFYKEKERTLLINQDSYFYNKFIYFKNFKTILMFLYFFMIFFEKPFWCYSNNFLYEKKKYLEINQCDENVALLGITYWNVYLYRIIEILILVYFISYIYIYKSESTLNQQIRKYLTYFLFFVQIVDIIVGLLMNYFPLVNMTLRCFTFILMSRSLREEWVKVFQILWYTRTVFFGLLFNLFAFSFIGYLFFKNKTKDFETLFKSFDSMFVLLTTCNFPDIMLNTFVGSKSSAFFFIVFLIVNYFWILGLFRALIYSSYSILNKNKTRKFIRHLKQHGTQESIVELMNNTHALDEEEFVELMKILKGAYIPEGGSSQNLHYSVHLHQLIRNYDEKEIEKKYLIIRILNNKFTEIFINILNIVVITFFIYEEKDAYAVVIHLIMSSYFVLESAFYFNAYGKPLFKLHIFRVLFYIINFISLVVFMVLLIFLVFDSYPNDWLVVFSQILLFLKLFRILILFMLFKEFQNIYIIFSNMYSVLLAIFFMLLSFFLIYSTVAMFLLGGKVEIDSYQDVSDVPNNYYFMNFNDYSSSFLTCFAFLIVNNNNFLTNALSHTSGEWFKAYYIIFFFIAVVIMINLANTYVLEMYMNLKSAFKRKNFLKFLTKEEKIVRKKSIRMPIDEIN